MALIPMFCGRDILRSSEGRPVDQTEEVTALQEVGCPLPQEDWSCVEEAVRPRDAGQSGRESSPSSYKQRVHEIKYGQWTMEGFRTRTVNGNFDHSSSRMDVREMVVRIYLLKTLVDRRHCRQSLHFPPTKPPPKFVDGDL